MGWLDKLSSLIKIDVSKLEKININFFSGNKSQKTTINGNVTQININGFDKNEQEKFKEILRDQVQENGIILLGKSLNTLTDFVKIDSSRETRTILDFFRGKISNSDLEILRFSIYLKKVFDRGECVSELKSQIIQKYGERGKNICNLYSAGYFESQIRPLYENLSSQSNFSKEKFDTIYEIIVTESPYAIFINNRPSQKESLQQVITKIKTSNKYGITNLNIHGIGGRNVEKILHILEEIKDKIVQPPNILKEGDVITVRVTLLHE